MISFKLTAAMEQRIRTDLARPHPFAHERVGFVICRTGSLGENATAILTADYLPVSELDYAESDEFGAMINRSALRKALERAYFERASIFHVHVHGHSGRPEFSHADLFEAHKFIPDFWKASPRQPHGLLLMSRTALIALVWVKRGQSPKPADRVTVVGWPIRHFAGEVDDRPA